VIRFNLLGFPVSIEPFFWLVVALLGGALRANSPQAVLLLLVWMLVVLVSILVHELGHALAGRRYGATPEIRLHGFGGMAVMHGGRFNRPQSILVSAAGPAFGLRSVCWFCWSTWELSRTGNCHWSSAMASPCCCT
jgi:stage IV sporulation protein FB